MKNSFENDMDNPRSAVRAKRRKTNLILNSLIVIVLLLIIFVSVTIFFGNGDKAESKQEQSVKVTQNDVNSKSSKNQDNNKQKAMKAAKSKDNSDSEKKNKDKTEQNGEDESEPVVTEGGSDGNVKSTIVNPEWQPVGTSQTGEHVAVYQESSADWQEMLAAVAAGSGIDPNNMTVWFMGNNGPNQTVATVSQKGADQTYRVYIEWVDGAGWKPSKVEELIKNDKR